MRSQSLSLLSPVSHPSLSSQYRDRIIFLQKPLDDELANQLIATVLYLDSEDNAKDLKLYINTMGGDIVPTLALHDTLKYVTSPVSTVAFGAAFGAAAFLLATGDKGRRAALPNTRIMLHHPSGAARGQASDIDNEARELMRTRNYVNRVLSAATGRSLKRIQHDFNRNCYFDVDEAIQYGLIDKVLPPPRTVQQELAESLAAKSSYPKSWA
jgi:ATP-dependent Clp protease protease subunit